MSGNRAQRVAALVQEEVSSLLIEKLEDPRLKGVTITRVSMTKDLKIARVYFSLIGDKNLVDKAAKALEGAKAKFKRAIGDNLDLKYTPQIEFFHDPNPEHADKIDRIISLIKNQKEKIGAGNES